MNFVSVETFLNTSGGRPVASTANWMQSVNRPWPISVKPVRMWIVLASSTVSAALPISGMPLPMPHVLDAAGDAGVLGALVRVLHGFERFAEAERLVENLAGGKRFARLENVAVADVVAVDADLLGQPIEQASRSQTRPGSRRSRASRRRADCSCRRRATPCRSPARGTARCSGRRPARAPSRRPRHTRPCRR